MVHGPPDTCASRRRHTITPPAARTLKHKPQSRRTRLGQNFLVDRYVARRIVGAAQISDCDQVLEIGPGKGALTRPLALKASSVLAVEVDDELAQALSSKLRDTENVSVLCQDALTLDPASHFTEGYKVVANLPYYVATPLIRKYLTARPTPTAMVVMIQKEVAENYCGSARKDGAAVGHRSNARHCEGAFLCTAESVQTQAQGHVSRNSDRSVPGAIWFRLGDPDAFIEFVAAGFRAPRKQIRNSLSLGLGALPHQVDSLLEAAHVDPVQRPATLDLSQWADLYESWLDVRQDPPQS